MFKIIPQDAEKFLETELGQKILVDMTKQGLDVQHFFFFVKIHKYLSRGSKSAKDIAKQTNLAPGNASKYYLVPLQRCGYVAKLSRYSWCLTDYHTQL